MTEDKAKQLLESKKAEPVFLALRIGLYSDRLLLRIADSHSNEEVHNMFGLSVDEVRFLVAHWRMTNGGSD